MFSEFSTPYNLQSVGVSGVTRGPCSFQEYLKGDKIATVGSTLLLRGRRQSSVRFAFFEELTSLVAIIRGYWIIIYYYVSLQGLSTWSRSQEGYYQSLICAETATHNHGVEALANTVACNHLLCNHEAFPKVCIESGVLLQIVCRIIYVPYTFSFCK